MDGRGNPNRCIRYILYSNLEKIPKLVLMFAGEILTHHLRFSTLLNALLILKTMQPGQKIAFVSALHH